MNLKLRWSMLIIMSIACLVLGALESVAITIDVDPEDLSTYDEIEGTSHTAVAITDIPYASVKWYVDGSLKETDYGSGSKRIADFTYTFNSGSTTGRQYEIKAIAFDSESASGDDAYDLTIWSDLEDVRTSSASVSDRFEVAGSYSASFSLTTPNSNYQITGAEVWVDGSSVASQNFSDVTNATIVASGSLGTYVGPIVSVKVKFFWKIAGAAIKWTAEKTFSAIVRSTIHGACTCAVDDNTLDDYYFSDYSSGDEYANTTVVKWDAGSAVGSETDHTSQAGVYMFYRTVPIGHTIDMSVDSVDHHRHGTGQYPPIKKCVYDHFQGIGEVGTSAGFNTTFETRRVDFDLTPDSVADPSN